MSKGEALVRLLLLTGLVTVVAAGSVACYALTAWLVTVLLAALGVHVSWTMACISGVLLVLMGLLVWFAYETRTMRVDSDMEVGVL